MKRVAVLTSGGDAPGMNAAIRAVVRSGVLHSCEMFGVRNGYEGLIAGDFLPLGPRDVGGIIHQGGTMLGTSRCPQFKTSEGQAAALEQLRRRDINALIVIGGNGSQSGAHALALRGMNVLGVASTIDNDLLGTDVSIGTTTALDTAMEAIDRLRVTAASHRRVFLVEVMGRHSGYLAAVVAIAGGAEAIVVPELDMPPEAIAQQLQASRQRGKSHAIVVVAEGARHGVDALSNYFRDQRQQLGLDLRITRLGHVQRGGAPGVYDRMLATRLGAASIEALLAAQTGVLVGLRRGAIAMTPLSEIAGRTAPLDLQLLELAQGLAT
ncbi:MAG TPA: ATP-dependent 6-phosphofructokinase [Steroidobacteraceae bacterium]|nr:ATP-dependent 6-phosphofructokinase [Steroidobacteraceae bacterium]